MSEGYRRGKEIHQEARGRDAESRAAYLREACGDDEALRREVEELLRYEAQADDKGFLEQPAIIARAFPMSRLSAGTKLGSCEVIELLGAGGMDI